MLAPLLRARIILFSCALSTNTDLCRSTVNAEMQQLERTKGFKSVGAALDKIRRLYTTGDAKKININAFIDILKKAVLDVERGVYYQELSSDHFVKEIIRGINEILQLNYKAIETYETFTKLVEGLNNIYKVVLSCGRLSEESQEGYLDIGPFHSAHYSTADKLLPNSKKSIVPTFKLQTANVSIPTLINMDKMTEHTDISLSMDTLCSRAQFSAIDDNSYKILDHYRESRDDIHTRVMSTYDRSDNSTIFKYANNLADIQHAYNRLYAYIFNDTQSRYVEIRARYVTACIIFMERIVQKAITVPTGIIQGICKKCKEMLDNLKGHPERLISQIKGITSNILTTINYILNPSEPARKLSSRGTTTTTAAPPARDYPSSMLPPNMKETIDELKQQQAAQAAATTKTPSFISRLGTGTKRIFGRITAAAAASSSDKQSLLQPHSPGGVGGRKMRRTRKMQKKIYRKYRSRRKYRRTNRKYSRRI